VGTFGPEGYVREPVEAHLHRGADELRAYIDRCFSGGGGIGLQHCAIADGGARCVLEYNCVNWARTRCRPGRAGRLRARCRLAKSLIARRR
jgi:hypothetical protein